MLPFTQPSWFRKFGKWSTQKGQTGRGNMWLASRVLLLSMPLPGFFASKFWRETSTTWSLPPMKECVLQVSPTIPSTSWCCGAFLYPTTKITCEKKTGFLEFQDCLEWNGIWEEASLKSQPTNWHEFQPKMGLKIRTLKVSKGENVLLKNKTYTP